MNKTLTIILGITSFALVSFVSKKDGLEGRTGSPGETTCATAGCHTGNPLNDPTGSMIIVAPTMTNWEYVPGTTYPIEVTISRNGNNKFGIGFEALQASGANGGTLSITNGVETQIKNAVIGGNSRANVVHRDNGGNAPNSKTFTFNWTAPATAVGNITFYAAGNASNSNNNTSGDFIYTRSQVITPASGVSVAEIEAISAVQIYPNPADREIRVSFESYEIRDLTFGIYGIDGRLMSETSYQNNGSGSQTVLIPLMPELGQGVYFLKITGDGIQTVNRFAVTR